MRIAAHFFTPTGVCGYLPDQQWRLEYAIVGEMTAHEYAQKLTAGWRRFGHAVFRPRCQACSACQSLRVDVARFRPNRSQRRNWRENQDVRLHVGPPEVTQEKLKLYDKFHAFQSAAKGWPLHAPKDIRSYFDSFVDNPFPSQEWRYFLNDRLVGVGYVDDLPVGYSAIYFIHDPDERERGLGVFNVLTLLHRAAERRLPHVYLGYHVRGCRSLEYKANYRPNEVLLPGGTWIPFHS
jgi:arginine-tRNA-protein transferase